MPYILSYLIVRKGEAYSLAFLSLNIRPSALKSPLSGVARPRIPAVKRSEIAKTEAKFRITMHGLRSQTSNNASFEMFAELL